jgi:hypothetical protein
MTINRKIPLHFHQPLPIRLPTGPRAPAIVSPRAGPWITGEVLTDQHH